MNDAHAHFFSSSFFRVLAKGMDGVGSEPELELPTRLGWDPPGTDDALADRWVSEWDKNGVHRGVLMASAPHDEESVAAAVARHPGRVVGAFMVDPATPELPARLDRAFGTLALRMACLFPAMHKIGMDDGRVQAVFEAAEAHGRAVFVHCGILHIGVRRKLGLACRFDLRLGDPLAVAAIAARFPTVPVIIPHFGAGLFREALMAADAAPNVYLDTSSSNNWIRIHPGLTLREVFARTLDSVGPSRILFGSDSSFFPRGWNASVAEVQMSVLDDLGLSETDRQLILGGNFSQVFEP